MSVIAVSPDLVEVTTLVLQPSQSFITSSFGMTGSIQLSTKPSPAILSLSNTKTGSCFSDSSGITDDNDLLFSASQAFSAGITDINVLMSSYIAEVEGSTIDARQRLKTYPYRFSSPSLVLSYSYDPTTEAVSVPTDFNEWTNLQRRVIKNSLIESQKIENASSVYGYSHYNCLNFVSSSNFGTSSAIVYPNFSNAEGIRDYTPRKEFTLDFFVKPKAPIDETGLYNAGTIFHISSSICVSLISGSSLGPDAKPDKFRILLQLSQSAETRPSNVNISSLPAAFPNDLIFATDEILRRDEWHRVTIRWGSQNRSNGTGSIKVDQVDTFFGANYPQLMTELAADALVIGNFYDSGDRVAKFFNVVEAVRNGTQADPVGSVTDPVGFKFSHPLNAEIHHLSWFKRFVLENELTNINSIYTSKDSLIKPSFFIAPFFTSSVTELSTYVTPSIKNATVTDSPMSYQLALGYNASYLNLQNFLIDAAQKKQPRAVGMSEGTAIASSFDSRTDSIDDLLMLQTANRKRNFSILPCDDGLFEPSFDIPSEDSSRFQYFGNVRNPAFMSLDSLAPAGTYIPGHQFTDFSYDGFDYPFLPLFQDMNYLVANNTMANISSNLVTVFTIPAAYYLNRIVPGTFVIADHSVSGSGGLSFELRDDSRGNLYRADAKSAHAKWNRVGAIFYSHGIVAILTPHLPFFGKNGFEMSFRGEVRKTIASFSVPAKAGDVNSSYNTTYKSFPPTNLRSEQADNFTYITGINLHDENLNIIMRAKLAQAVQKREGDEILFRLRYDF